MSWATVPLKRVASLRVSNVDKKTVGGEQPVRLCNYTDVYYRDTIRPDQEFMVATASGEQVAAFRLRPGDVIITKDSETSDDIGVPAYVEAGAPDLICGYHLALIRPVAREIDGRFLFWSMASGVVRDQLTSTATGVTRFGLRSDSIGGVLLPFPAKRQQRMIADFLDAEIARIDALISKKRQLSGLLAARTQTVVEREVLGLAHDAVHPARSRWFTDVPRGWNETVLGQMNCEVQTGPFGSQLHASEYVQDGWPVVNPANLTGGRLAAIPSMAVSSEKRDELKRHVLQRGDIVFGRRGEMGRAGLVDSDKAGWLCGTGSIRLRLSGKAMLPGYLKALLETRALRAYFGLSSVGSTMENLNAGILRSTPVLLPPVADQRAIIRRTFDIERRAGAHQTAVSRQIALLQERRQALITAAVTGELDIAGAA